jgi:DNA-binding Lrp family transcriptional regulator
MESVIPGLDATDYKILCELCADGRTSDVCLGERVNLSSTAAARRRKILEDRQLITGYTANLNRVGLGFSIVVIVAIELSSQAEHILNEFELAVTQCPSVTFCSFVSGDTDFLMIVNVPSFDAYDRIYRSELSILPHVARIRSSFVMREVARHTAPPILFQGWTQPPAVATAFPRDAGAR